jgi:hypothetical protein
MGQRGAEEDQPAALRGARVGDRLRLGQRRIVGERAAAIVVGPFTSVDATPLAIVPSHDLPIMPTLPLVQDVATAGVPSAYVVLISLSLPRPQHK